LLVHCAPLRDWVERVDVAVTDLEGLKGASVAAPTLVRVFVQLVHDYRYGVGQDDTLVSPWSPFAKPLPPLKLASRLVPTVMPGRKTVLEQQDAQEFLFLLLDSLHAALLDASTNEQDDPARGVYYLSDSEDEGSGSISSNGSGGGSSSSSSSGSGGGGNAAGKNGAHEQWTEIGPASRKSVVITTEGAWRDSAISHLLRGRMRSTLKRRANSSVSIEPFFALSLEPLAGSAVGAALPEKRRHGVQAPTCTLMQLLKAYLEPERVTTVSNNAAVAREKQTSLEQLPPVLLIHIARFAFVGGVTRKLDTHVEFGAQLEVPIDLFAVHAAPASAPQYRLRGVVRHHGASASSGHYTACVLVQKPATKKEPASDEWYLFDDMNVSTTSESAVLDSTDSAYLLLYSRV
jgi:hypothetical protein